MVFLVSACQPGDALPAGGHVSAIRQTEGRSFSDFSSADLRPRWGRSAGPHFSPMRNGGKNRLGRSPLSTPLGVRGWACVKLVFGPFPLLWSLFVPPHQATMAAGPIAGWFSPPGLPWPSGVPAAGGFAAPSCCAAVRAVACPARWFPCIALGDSGGASPSPTPNNARNSAMFRGFLRPAPGNWEQLLARVRP